jgi:nicotinate-nucleotide adenylyltransferase
LQALKRLGLDELWWLVSPQNPLKSEHGMALYEQRLAAARRAAQHPAIRVSDCERRFNSRYSADTIAQLRKRYPRDRFVWVMGADNLAEFTRWRRWQDIFQALPIAIFDRQPYAQSACASKPLQRFSRQRVAEQAADDITSRQPPAWVFLHGRLHAASASAIRKNTAGRDTAPDNSNQRGDDR